jgi:DNA recombination protein RmuC
VIDMVAGEVDNLRDRPTPSRRPPARRSSSSIPSSASSASRRRRRRCASPSWLRLRRGQEKLRSEMLAETLKTLSEHARADRELLQSGLKAPPSSSPTASRP